MKQAAEKLHFSTSFPRKRESIAPPHLDLADHSIAHSLILPVMPAKAGIHMIVVLFGRFVISAPVFGACYLWRAMQSANSA
ncbi:MAG: hypothetical protein HQL41_02600 [Alphaproteobacteria bacterium]|nr:hypothetical protein [Alphaproteobacteria bacterium]